MNKHLLAVLEAGSRVKQRMLRPIRHRRISLRVARPGPSISATRDLYLFFTPEAGITPHASAQFVLAKTLAERGHAVAFTLCHQSFKRCVNKDMMRVTDDPVASVQRCFQCTGQALAMTDAYALPYVKICGLRTAELAAEVRLTVAAAPADLREFVHDGISFGLLAGMDAALSLKISDFANVSAEHRRVWLELIESSVLSYEIVRQLCREYRIKAVVHHNDYSMNLAARLAVERNGGRAISVSHASHRNIDRRRICLRAAVGPATYQEQVDAWPRFRDLSLSPQQVEDVGEDILLRMMGRGTHTFSPARNLICGDPRASLGLSKKKLIVAYTSSLDEMVATHMTLDGLKVPTPTRRHTFGDQIGWIKALADFVRDRDDVQVAVRIHPREGAKSKNKVAVDSQHLLRLRAAFEGRATPNLRFIWPDDPISSYNLGELADVALFSWSTIGLEMARLGVTTLACTNGVAWFPHDDFLEFAETPEEYFAVLSNLLERRVSLDTIARSFRWYHLMHLGTSLDFSDVVPAADFWDLPPWKMPSEADAVESVIVGAQHPIDIYHARRTASIQGEEPGAEAEAIRRQMRRVIRFLFTGDAGADDYALTYMDGEEQDASPPPLSDRSAATLRPAGELLEFAYAGQVFSHYSPAARRLAPLVAQSIVQSGVSVYATTA